MTPSLSTDYLDRKRLPPIEEHTSNCVPKKRCGKDRSLTRFFIDEVVSSSGESTERTFAGSITPSSDVEKIIAIEENQFFTSEHSSSSSRSPLQDLSRTVSSDPIDGAALRKAALEQAFATLQSGRPVSFEAVESISTECFTKENGYSRSVSSRHHQFNRWHIARPWDHNLCGGQDEENNMNYVNASRVVVNDQMFFASDAPKPLAFERFWNFVWTEEIKVIVNLTEMYEKGEKQADSYWIENSDAEKMREFGNRFNPNPMRLTLQSENFIFPKTGASEIDIGDLGQRSFDEKKIQYVVQRTYTLEKGSVVRLVTHYHYRHWSDHGAPASPEERAAFLTFVDHIAGSFQKDPILVHCSAGLGRTGAFLAVYHARQQQLAGTIYDHPELAAGEIILQMRAQRNGLIRSSDQFQFVIDMMRQPI